MGQLVQTTKGLVDSDLLVIKDITSFDQNSRFIATEWYLNDELVRRDVNVNILNGINLNGEQESM